MFNTKNTFKKQNNIFNGNLPTPCKRLKKKA